MSFPVLGQIAGLGLVFLLTYFYAKNMPNIVEKVAILNDVKILFLILFLLVLPGLAIFMKAFWEYLVAYGAVNSMVENMLKSGKVYDFDAHTELVKRRTMTFVGLWFLFGIFSLISIIPFFWVPCGVLTVFFVLIFQIFTFEPEQTPFGYVKRSLELVKGHFLSTFFLLALVGALTYVFVPQLANLFFEYTNLTKIFSNMVLPIINELPMAVECNLLKFNEDGICIGEIVNVSADESVLGDDGKIDPQKVQAITFDPIHNTYIKLGEKVGNAFSDGKKINA
jgi:hypothetical protein